MTLRLYYTPHTRSLRPRWLLEELELPYDLRPVDLFGGEGGTEEYRRIHPLGQVPALEIDGEILLESGAICHWLADREPDRGLAPAMDDPARKIYEQWMFFAPATLEAPPWLVILHTQLLPETKRAGAVVPWALERHAANLAMLESALGAKDYLLGERFSTADVMVGSVLMWLPDELEPFPVLGDYTRRLRERPAYQRAVTN